MEQAEALGRGLPLQNQLARMESRFLTNDIIILIRASMLDCFNSEHVNTLDCGWLNSLDYEETRFMLDNWGSN